MRRYIIVEQESVAAWVAHRSAPDTAWRAEALAGATAMLDLPGIGARFALGEVYEGLVFDGD